MSYVNAVPDSVSAAAADVAGVGSTLRAAYSAVAGPTTAVVTAAGDEVSGAIASLFSACGKEFQALSAQLAQFHSQFVQALNAGAGAYASTEAASSGLLGNLGAVLHQRPGLVPNVAVSADGLTLLKFGSATATSGTGDLAIAVGVNSTASAVNGTGNIAAAFGQLDTASAGGVPLPPASPSAVGPISDNGNHDLAFVWGDGSTAYSASGNNNLAAALGTENSAYAAVGNNNLAAAFDAPGYTVAEGGGNVVIGTPSPGIYNGPVIANSDL